MRWWYLPLTAASYTVVPSATKLDPHLLAGAGMVRGEPRVGGDGAETGMSKSVPERAGKAKQGHTLVWAGCWE